LLLSQTISIYQYTTLVKKELSYASQGDHSGRRKRRITALNVTVFYRNTSACSTSRFFARIRLLFFFRIFVVLQADVKRRRNTPVFAVLHRLRLFSRISALTGSFAKYRSFTDRSHISFVSRLRSKTCCSLCTFI